MSEVKLARNESRLAPSRPFAPVVDSPTDELDATIARLRYAIARRSWANGDVIRPAELELLRYHLELAVDDRRRRRRELRP